MNNLLEALVKASQSFSPVKKDTQGYGYKYASLDCLLEAVRKPLLENGLVIVQMPYFKENMITIKTTLYHVSGEKLENNLSSQIISLKVVTKEGKVKEGVPVQEAGATITYLRRYAITSLLCLASEEDTDGVQKKENKPVEKPAKVVEQPKETEQGEFITPAQRTRLHAIANKHGWETVDVKLLLKDKFKIESSSEIKVADYEAVVNLLEGNL